VLGPVDSADLGLTLMHEHIILVNHEIEANYPGHWNPDIEVPKAIKKLTELKEQGVDTVVDLTVLGLGRNVELIRQIVEPTGLNVIVASGAYYFDELPFFFRNRGPGSFHGGPELLDEFFTQDLEQGIAGTGVRAGILKCVTDVRGVTADVDRVLRAIARVHRATGKPISTHTHADTRRGLDQQHVFREEGVDLSRVVIGHCGDTTDLEYLTTLMDAGSYIGMDRFGLDTFLPTPQRVATVAELVRRGYASKMVLSHDTTCFSMSYESPQREQKLPDWNHRFLLDSVLPMLRERGVDDDAIDQMLVHNPRAIFENGTRY
jgi:phosphotriesterase-related protein